MPSTKVLLQTLSMILLLGGATAHPGEDHSEEIAARETIKHIERSLAHCNEKLTRRGHHEQAVARREARVKDLRRERGLPEHAPMRRFIANPSLDESHHSEKAYNLLTPADSIFASNASCVLTPWSTEGPFLVEGEFIRHDMRENQPGVDLVLEFEWIDYNTCEPIPNLYVDVWHANSTGVYSGIFHGFFPNGNNNDSSNLEATFFRAVQPTDAYGLTEFTTKFPGNYNGRATHIHIMSNINGTVLNNGTYSPGNYTHVSQVYFDQDLLTEVYALEPYSGSTQHITPNTEDPVLNTQAIGSDPVMEYILLGDSLEDGLFAWKKLGVDVVPVTNITVAALHYSDGGVMITPTGAPPSGFTLPPT